MSVLPLLLLLAVVQGLTEFLPVSSSGHLVLIREFFGSGALPEDATVEVLLHLGTLLAVLLFYRRDVARLAAGVVGAGAEVASQRRLFGLLCVALLPLFPLALIEGWLERALFSNTLVPSLGLLLTGGLLWWSRGLAPSPAAAPAGEPGRDPFAALSAWQALAIGCAQALAVTPGVSRSGSTIVAGLLVGLPMESAAAFSFLLSIPAVAGANLLKLPDVLRHGSELGPGVLLLAASTSALVGYLAIGMLLWIAKARRLSWFAPYCWLAGTLCLAVTLWA